MNRQNNRDPKIMFYFNLLITILWAYLTYRDFQRGTAPAIHALCTVLFAYMTYDWYRKTGENGNE